MIWLYSCDANICVCVCCMLVCLSLIFIALFAPLLLILLFCFKQIKGWNIQMLIYVCGFLSMQIMYRPACKGSWEWGFRGISLNGRTGTCRRTGACTIHSKVHTSTNKSVHLHRQTLYKTNTHNDVVEACLSWARRQVSYVSWQNMNAIGPLCFQKSVNGRQLQSRARPDPRQQASLQLWARR